MRIRAYEWYHCGLGSSCTFCARSRGSKFSCLHFHHGRRIRDFRIHNAHHDTGADYDNLQHSGVLDDHIDTDSNYGAPDNARDNRHVNDTDIDNDRATNHDHSERGSHRHPGGHDRLQRTEALDCRWNRCIRVEFIGH